MRKRMGALENQAEQTWTSHQITLLSEMNSVASNALENKRRSLLSEATAELQKHERQSHCQKFNKESKSNKLRMEKKLKF